MNVRFGPRQLGSSAGRALCPECRVLWIRLPVIWKKCLPWVCCTALLCCMFDLACFFLPSFSSLIQHVHNVILNVHVCLS